MADELPKCGCGGEPKLVKLARHWIVECDNCRVGTHARDTETWAYADWTRAMSRAASAAPPRITREALKKLFKIANMHSGTIAVTNEIERLIAMWDAAETAPAQPARGEETCPACHGSGTRIVHEQTEQGDTHEVDCDQCSGTGATPPAAGAMEALLVDYLLRRGAATGVPTQAYCESIARGIIEIVARKVTPKEEE